LYAYEKKQLLDVIHRLSLISVSLNLVLIRAITRGVYLSNARQQASAQRSALENKTTQRATERKPVEASSRAQE
jgi:hypothetical protein